MDKICKRCSQPRDISTFKVSRKTGKPLNPCALCRSEIKKIDRENNRERDNLAKAKWAERNKESVKNSKKKWKRNNIGKVKADKARRKEYVKRATPKWLSQVQLEAIDLYYLMAELRTSIFGVKYEVDHIIPLRGKNVSGLNVPWNLEVVTKKLNLEKSNKLLPWRIRG